MTALLLLGPWTPMLFQGEEFGATTPFLYFAEVGDEGLREAIRKGRFEFLAQFQSAASDEIQEQIAIPHDEETFHACKLDWAERGGIWLDLHRDLIRLRREDARLRRQISGGIDGAVLADRCFLLRFLSDDAVDSRLLIINLGARMTLSPLPEPLLAPPADYIWETLWTSELARYAGPGAVEINADEQWLLPAQAALLFRPRKRIQPRKKPQIH